MARSRAWRWIEAAVILLAVLSLWPWIFGWKHPGWRVFTYAMLGAMAALFIVNAVRLWRLGHPKSDDDGGRA